MGQQTSIYFHRKTLVEKPQEPIKFKFDNDKRKNCAIKNLKTVLNGVQTECNIIKKYKFINSDEHQFPNDEINNCKENIEIRNKRKIPSRTNSEPNLRHHHRIRRKSKFKKEKFGYQIQDVDEFLSKATLNKPANIPVVLAFPSILYQTRISGDQIEINLPLGMVVNAIFRNTNWLYVQTPHAEEGYISYSACLPLGIIPPPYDDDDNLSPCWEKSSDIFPKPLGNVADLENTLSYKSDIEGSISSRSRYRGALSTCGEKSVDRLYLRAAAIAKGKGTRHTLLVINEKYRGGKDSLSVSKNDVVFLLNASIKGWFYVRNKEGKEGYIPSVIAGHGFL